MSTTPLSEQSALGAGIPAPPSGSIVMQDGNPSIPPPPSGSIVTPTSTQTQTQNDPNARFAVQGTGTISATPQPKSFFGKYAQYLENVSNDVKYGTDHTGVGTVLKALGAHGVYNGNPEAVGDFMASLPLGLLKATKGTSELMPTVIGGPKGQTWQGVKDLVGGGLQATQIPAAFAAPEESALSKEGLLSDAANAAGRATEGASSKVQQTIANIAKEAGGVEADIKPTAADPYGFRQTATEQIGKYKTAANKLDELSKNAFSDAQQDVEDAASDFTAAGKKAYREAQKNLNDLIDKYKPALKDAGVDADSMKADYRKGMANNKIAAFLNKTTEETGKDVMQATAKSGPALKEAFLDLAQNQKDLLGRAGWDENHINQAVQSARELIPSMARQVMKAAGRYAAHAAVTGPAVALADAAARELVK